MYYVYIDFLYLGYIDITILCNGNSVLWPQKCNKLTKFECTVCDYE